MRSTILSLLATLALALPVCAREFAVRPAPQWVEKTAAELTLNVAKENVRWGIYDILSEEQTRVHGGETSRYYRTVRKVLSPSGVQNASELSFDFDPTFEKLTIHSASIVRDGKSVQAFDAADVRVIEKEEDADDRIYDGERTALLFLNDVRPGDIIDYSWSIDGANPLLAGKFTETFELSSGVPARLVRTRIVWPLGRPLQWRGAEPRIATNGAEQVFVWERRDVAALDVEDEIPSWYEPWETVQLSEFASWSEVAQWSTAMFKVDAKSSAAIKTLADKIRREHLTPDGRLTAAIRFVQDDIRYLGIEMGRNSHEPHQPSETLDQRWGDCKDKALLLSALLRELGVEAYPALVNTKLRSRLINRLPSPFLFDHVIVQAIVAGKTYWIDGTISDQGGALTSLETPNDGYALVVRPESTALAKIETNEKGATRVEKTYTTRNYKEPVLLDVRTTYSGGEADAMRSALATMSKADLAKDRINDLAADQPKIEAAGALQIFDDRLRNNIVIKEKYRVPDLWRDGSWTWYPREIESHLQRPDTMIRSMPLAFDYPLDVAETVTFNFPEELSVEGRSSVTETPTFRHEYTIDRNGRTIVVKQTLHARKDVVDVAAVPDHLTKLNGIWSEIGFSLSPDGAQPATAEKDTSAAADIQRAIRDTPAVWKWTFGVTFIGLLVGVATYIAVPRARRARRVEEIAAVAPRRGFGPGEAPMSAVPVRHEHEIGLHLSNLACRCGARLFSDADVQRARYGEQDLTIITRQCGKCGQEQAMYFTAA
ncbi:MAG TPA: DUF3857 domain-containing protein [Thermoanaerobaculia bacterium]|nr:DUF3857 domain-containing protein [Thermoanaerobaculia bacterium]